MQSIKRMFLLIIVPLFAGWLLISLVNITRASGINPTAPKDPAVPQKQTVAESGMPVIQSSRRISIPFGFASPLPLLDNGQAVQVMGHGSCTLGQTFTVAVTVTHTASGASAHGNLVDEPCAGEANLQIWQLTATADSYPLTMGPGETCGLVQTFDGKTVTGEQNWCVDILLGDYVYLPVVTR